MASNDLFRSHGNGRLLPRAAQTTFQASDLLRASTNGGNCIPDSKLQKRRTSLRGVNKTRPRLPQRSRYVSDNGLTTRGTLLDSSVLADSATTSIKGPNTYGYMNKAVVDPENLDSGLGVEPFLGSLSDENSSTSTDSDSDVEMDCAHTKVSGVMHQSTLPTDMHVRELKQKPESHVETKDEMSYIQDDLNFKKRLEEIKRQATERYELNKTLQLLLPDSEGDT